MDSISNSPACSEGWWWQIWSSGQLACRCWTGKWCHSFCRWTGGDRLRTLQFAWSALWAWMTGKLWRDCRSPKERAQLLLLIQLHLIQLLILTSTLHRIYIKRLQLLGLHLINERILVIMVYNNLHEPYLIFAMLVHFELCNCWV